MDRKLPQVFSFVLSNKNRNECLICGISSSNLHLQLHTLYHHINNSRIHWVPSILHQLKLRNSGWSSPLIKKAEQIKGKYRLITYYPITRNPDTLIQPFFACKICNWTSNTVDDLKRHLNSHSVSEVSATPSDSRLSFDDNLIRLRKLPRVWKKLDFLLKNKKICPICGVEGLGKMKRHMMSTHLKKNLGKLLGTFLRQREGAPCPRTALKRKYSLLKQRKGKIGHVFTCLSCDFGTNSLEDLKEHLNWCRPRPIPILHRPADKDIDESEVVDPLSLLENADDPESVPIPDYAANVRENLELFVMDAPTSPPAKALSSKLKKRKRNLPTDLFFFDIPTQHRPADGMERLRRNADGFFCPICYGVFISYKDYDLHLTESHVTALPDPVPVALRSESNLPIGLGVRYRFPKMVAELSMTKTKCTGCGQNGFQSRAQFHQHLLDCKGKVPNRRQEEDPKRGKKKKRLEAESPDDDEDEMEL